MPPEDPALSPRGHYNNGLSALASGDAEAAAAAFLTARDTAGPDPLLRYRAAFNLGLALAAQADAALPAAGVGAVEDNGGAGASTEGTGAAAPAALEKAIGLLRQSAAWFNDAVRLAPAADEDARTNLELISRRILALADQLNEGDKLEGRLDRLIDDQRGVRDQVRRLLGEVLAEAAGAEPVGFQSAFDSLASRQRVLMAEIGDSIDLATEERLFIEQAPPESRAADAEARAARLAAVTDYLERARQSLGDARRRLRRLQGERGHRAADRGLAELKRAREQLRDPLEVLQAVARDEAQLIAHTAALAAATGAVDAERQAPAWLTPKHLGERQEDAAVRAGGVLTIFEAMQASAPAGVEADADADRARAAVAEAAPIVERGLASMRDAMRALDAADAAGALPAQHAAAAALANAIEVFADVKALIELAYLGQQRIVALLSANPDDEAAQAALDPADRAAALGETIFAGQRRLSRLAPLLAEEAAGHEDAPPSRNEPAAQTPGKDAQGADEAAAQARQLYERAERLRALAADGLARLAEAVDAIAATGGGDADKLGTAQTQAAATLETLAELRRLFFSVVEHLRALHADQTQTHDETATAQFESTVDKLEELPAELAGVAERQGRHAGIGEQLAAALARQADAAAQNDAGAGVAPPAGRPSAERVVEAGEQMRQATARMRGAAASLEAAAARAASMSPELEPVMADQVAALEHIEAALLALSPPGEGNDAQQDEQQGDGAAQQAGERPDERDGEDARMSERQALKRLQAIRDREAERQRRRQASAGREPVEKDW